MDGAILVVSATDGPQEQTREHIILAREIGIPYIIVYINKVDMLPEKDFLEMIEYETRELLESYSYPGMELPVITGSAKKALEEDVNNPTDLGINSINKLMEAVDEFIPQPNRPLDKPFLMPIEDVFSISGRGTVVTGRIEQGSIKLNEEVNILGLDKDLSTTCTGIEMFRKEMESAEAGDNVGLLLRGVKRDKVSRGQIVSKDSDQKVYTKFKAKVYILTKDEGGRHKGFFQDYKPQFFIRTANITGSFEFSDGVEVALPGDTLEFTVNLISPLALTEGLRFTIREGRLTVGAGVISGLIS